MLLARLRGLPGVAIFVLKTFRFPGASAATRRSSTLPVLLAASAALSGCASMSVEECLVADWESVGLEDGTRGRGSDGIGRYREACAKAGVTPDLAAYEKGRNAGLVQFCRPARGYEFGRKGGSYAGVCPSETEGEFLAAYNEGREYYEFEQAVSEAESAVTSGEYSLRAARKELDKGERRLDDDSLTANQRSKIEKKNRELATRIGRLEAEQSQLLIELGERREQLRVYESDRD